MLSLVGEKCSSFTIFKLVNVYMQGKKSNRTYKWLILSKREYYMLGNINDSVINIHITEIKTLDIISNKVFSMRILEG